jgi:DNA recombination-dependent growth factor C
MAKSGLSDTEKAELALAGIAYIHEQLSQIFPNYAHDMESMMANWIDQSVLPAASKTKIKVEIKADLDLYKAKGKR